MHNCPVALGTYQSAKRSALRVLPLAVCIVFTSLAYAVPREMADKVEILLSTFTISLDQFAAAEKLASSDFESVKNSFQKTIAETPAIRMLLRTNSNGLVLNEVTHTRANYPMRAVADQPWFTRVRESMAPYRGTSRDSSGMLHLFWVWPIILRQQDTSGSRFGGALAAKVDLSLLLSNSQKALSFPYQIRYRGVPVYSQNWDVVAAHEELSLNVSNVKDLSIRILSDRVAEPRQTSIDSRDTEEEGAGGRNHPDSKRGILFALVILLPGVAIVSLVVLRRKTRLQRPTEMIAVQATSPLTDEPVVAVNSIAPKSDPVDLTGEDSDPSVSSVETETKTISIITDATPPPPDLLKAKPDQVAWLGENAQPAAPSMTAVADQHMIQTKAPSEKDAAEVYNAMRDSIYREAAAHFREPDPGQLESHERLRLELYREVHGEISHWVIYELTRLNNRLENLAGQIRRIEKTGSVGDTNTLRSETKAVSGEITRLKGYVNDSESAAS